MKVYLRTRDFAVTGESFELLEHHKWQMLVTMPQPENLESYYNSTDYISHSDDSKGIVNAIYRMIRRRTIRRKIRWLSKYMNKGDRVLDFGAGTAEFVLAAQKNGWHAEGVEPNEAARGKAQSKGISLKRELQGLSGSFQVITLWHVLEHLPELERSIDQLVSRLRPGGTLFLAVPNYCSYDARHYGEYWAAFDTPRHLWHFSPQAIASIFQEKGFRVMHKYPMWFDAFYIALISEKYRGSKFKFVSALCIGLLSNLSALRTGEYSSLTYVLQRI